MRVPLLDDILRGARSLHPRVRLGAAIGGLALLGIVVVAIAAGISGGGKEPPVLVAQVTATPPPTATPRPTSTPRPTPTPTATPSGPVPAAPIPLGEAAGLSNPSSIGLPPAPGSSRTSVANVGGVMRMVAPAIGLDSYIETVGVANGMMESPDDDGNHAVGWYAPGGGYEFGVPGQANNSVFSAHETWNHMQGPFYRLHQARVGDEIFIYMADGEQRRYQVASVIRYPAGAMPMAEVLWPSDRPENEDWITLYTCGGEIVYDGSGYGDYLSRDVLVAKWVGPAEPAATPAPDALQLSR